MEQQNSKDSGLFGSWILFILLVINLFYQQNLVSGIIFLVGTFFVFDTYRRIHQSYSKK